MGSACEDDMTDQLDGVVHQHDRRTCWDCGGQGVVVGALSLRTVEAVLRSLGWRFLEDRGRMICSECRWKRREAAERVRTQ